MKKYELTSEIKEVVLGRMLFRIKALKDFGDVKAGDLGGFVEKESNLEQTSDAWVYDDAMVYGDGWVAGKATVRDNAVVCEEATVCEEAVVRGNAIVCGRAAVCGKAVVCEEAVVREEAVVYEEAVVCGDARVRYEMRVFADAKISCNDDYILVKDPTTTSLIAFFKNNTEKIYVSDSGWYTWTLSDFRKQAAEYSVLADFAENYFRGRR